MRTMLDLQFKGTRDYVQGPDIYSAILDNLRLEQTSFRMSIHHFARRQCEMVVGAEEGQPPAHAAALFWTTQGGVPARGWVQETDVEISRRVPYDEEPVWSRCRRSGTNIEMSEGLPPGYAPIEVLVSLTKRLHLDALASTPVKWVFTQLDVRRPLAAEDVSLFRVSLEQTLGSRFTKSAIFVGSERLGSIHFAGTGA